MSFDASSIAMGVLLIIDNEIEVENAAWLRKKRAYRHLKTRCGAKGHQLSTKVGPSGDKD